MIDQIEEVAKLIPIKEAYGDLMSPAAKQTGVLLEDIAKTIRLALFPIQLSGALQDRFRDFVDRSVRRVPEAKRITPAPQILGPVLEAIKYEPNDTPIDEMFSNLLSSAMDTARVDTAHPAFTSIIKQLSSDEAVLLQSLVLGRQQWVYRYKFDVPKKIFYDLETIEDSRPISKIIKVGNFDLYMLHLHNLGLASYYDFKAQEQEYRKIQRKVGDTITPTREQIGVTVFKELKLTPWGAALMDACKSHSP
jgi:hypothetical protein